MSNDRPTEQGIIIREVDEAKILEIVERVLHAREAQRDMERASERAISAQELQRAVLEIRDAIKMQANATAELMRAVQLGVSRGGSGVGGGF